MKWAYECFSTDLSYNWADSGMLYIVWVFFMPNYKWYAVANERMLLVILPLSAAKACRPISPIPMYSKSPLAYEELQKLPLI